jgi:hypothetical protein
MSDIALRAHLAPVLGDAADGSNVRRAPPAVAPAEFPWPSIAARPRLPERLAK